MGILGIFKKEPKDQRDRIIGLLKNDDQAKLDGLVDDIRPVAQILAVLEHLEDIAYTELGRRKSLGILLALINASKSLSQEVSRRAKEIQGRLAAAHTATVVGQPQIENCPYYRNGTCTAGEGKSACSLQVGSYYTSCNVYAWMKGRSGL